MILSCDPVCWGTEHVAFNSGVLQIILAAFPTEPVAFFGEQSHVELLQDQMGSELARKVIWNRVRIPERGAEYLERLRTEIEILKALYRRLPAVATNLIVFQTILPSTLLALKLTRRHLGAGVAVQAMLHGELSQIIKKRSLRPLRRLEDVRTAMGVWGRRGIQYLVLEENIKAVLLRHMPFLTGRVEAVEHPLCPNEHACDTIPLEYPIRFGFLGMANEEKGFPEFVKLASKVVQKHPHLAEFHALGKYPGLQSSVPATELLTVKPAQTHLTRQDFAAGLRRLHFAVFPYKPSHYGSSPSGTLMDALAWEKPLIATRIPLFVNLFNRHGNIGYLFDSYGELERIVEKIVGQKPDTKLYQRQVMNLRNARASRTAAAVAPLYRRACMNAWNLRGNTPKQNANARQDRELLPSRNSDVQKIAINRESRQEDSTS